LASDIKRYAHTELTITGGGIFKIGTLFNTTVEQRTLSSTTIIFSLTFRTSFSHIHFLHNSASSSNDDSHLLSDDISTKREHPELHDFSSCMHHSGIFPLIKVQGNKVSHSKTFATRCKILQYRLLLIS